MKRWVPFFLLSLLLASTSYAQPVNTNVGAFSILRVSAGSAGSPSISFANDPDTGLYWVSANNIGVTTGGTKRWDVNTTRVASTLSQLFSASLYINWGTVVGSSGYGIRDNSGAIEFKNSGGSWAALISSITGGTCTNQFARAISASGSVTCATVVLTADVNGTLPSLNGGTESTLFAVSGPLTSKKTYTFPNASTTVLTTNAAVTVGQGGSGADLSATGGTGQLVKQASTGASFTVGTIASANLSDTANIDLLDTAQSITGRKDFTQYTEKNTAPTISSNVLTINMQSGTWFSVSLNANITTFTISNPPATNTVGNFTVVFTADGTVRTITWPASVKWPAATAPTMTGTSGRIDIVYCVTTNNGTSYLCNATQNIG